MDLFSRPVRGDDVLAVPCSGAQEQTLWFISERRRGRTTSATGKTRDCEGAACILQYPPIR